MNKKNGFTLTELLGIIIILGVVTLIVFPLINKTIKDSKLDAYNAQVKTIIEAAKTWAVNNPNRLPEIDSETEENVSVLELISTGYIKDANNNQIVNPMDETKTMDGCVVIKYSKDYNQYTYDYNEECKNREEVTNLISFIGNENIKILIGKEYKDEGVSILDDFKDSPVNITTEIFYNGNIVDKINTNSFKTYQIKYYATSGIYEQTLIRNVEIYDDIAPVITINGSSENQTITLEADSDFKVPEPVITDNSVFEGSPYITSYEVENDLNISQEGDYQIKYIAYDYKGNSSELILNIKVVKRYYSITVNQTYGGTIEIIDKAKEGDEVTFTTSPITKWMYDGALIKDSNGEIIDTITSSETKFTMVKDNITIEPNWKRETIYFYDYGTQLETGGFKQSYYSNTYGSRYMKFNSDNIEISCPLYGDISYTSINPVDITGLKRMRVYFNWRSDYASRYGFQNSAFTFGISKATSANASSSFDAYVTTENIPAVGMNTITVDVSKLEGSYYLHLVTREWNSGKNVQLTIYQIYGEG